MNNEKSFIVIGAGLVGLATGYRLLERYPSAKVTLLEKEPIVGSHQSTHNSGVLHAGLYYAPGSAKAKLAVSGIKQMIDFCQKEKIDHEVCGKLVVAVTEDELPRLEELYRRGISNGLSGLKQLDRNQLKKYEPYVNGISAVHVPEEGIVDYRQVCNRMAALIQERGGEIITNAAVNSIAYTANSWVIQSATAEFNADFLINCAGLYCDRIAEIAGEIPELKIVPFRGEYYQLLPAAQHLVKNLIYPVPNPQFPFLGVHFTRMIQGGIEAGPNAVLAFAREGYRLSKINPKELFETVTYPGLWHFLRKYPNTAFSEFAQSLSKTRFCQALQRLIPDIREKDLTPGHAGVRAQAMKPDGELVNDFHLLIRDNAIHVLNAPSPAATASLAIGQHIVSQLPF
jgi:(S)-2-hydroxyglutarate dehydrogenase